MSIDMTGLARLGTVGRDKVLTEIPRGQAKEGIHFAFKIKKAQWVKGEKYGYMYHLDVVIRTLDMQTVLGALLWKMYPSMLPEEITEAIDCDTYDDQWYLVRTEVNAKSKADPPRTLLHLIDTQQGIGMQESGPSKPAAAHEQDVGARSPAPAGEQPSSSSERGQPGAGGMLDTAVGSAGADQPGQPLQQLATEPPAAPCPQADPLGDLTDPCPHLNTGFFYARDGSRFQECLDCGERVG